MGKRKILAADTDVALLQALAVGVRSGGYEIVLAQTADQAAERARSAAPDLILLDLAFGTVLDTLRGTPAADTPVVFMTSEPAERLDAAVRRRAAAVIHKPFDAPTLLATLGEVLGTAVRAPQTLG